LLFTCPQSPPKYPVSQRQVPFNKHVPLLEHPFGHKVEKAIGQKMAEGGQNNSPV